MLSCDEVSKYGVKGGDRQCVSQEERRGRGRCQVVVVVAANVDAVGRSVVSFPAKRKGNAWKPTGTN